MISSEREFQSSQGKESANVQSLGVSKLATRNGRSGPRQSSGLLGHQAACFATKTNLVIWLSI